MRITGIVGKNRIRHECSATDKRGGVKMWKQRERTDYELQYLRQSDSRFYSYVEMDQNV